MLRHLQIQEAVSSVSWINYHQAKHAYCLGKEKILALFRKGAGIMGLSNPEEFMPHTLRHMLGSYLSNDPGMSLKGCMTALRHNSAAASLNYQADNRVSEENRLIALGFVPPEEEPMLKKKAYKTPSATKQPTETNIVTEEPSSNQSSCAKLPSSDHNTDDYSSSSDYVKMLQEVPSTQHAIDIVKKDLTDISSSTSLIPLEKSEERRQIIELGQQVYYLKRKLGEQAKKIEYYERELFGSFQLEEYEPAKKKPRPRNPYSKLRDSFHS